MRLNFGLLVCKLVVEPGPKLQTRKIYFDGCAHIARKCGILTEGGLCVDGPSFRKMSETEVHNILPRLQVLARSSPQDKKTLVEYLKKLDEVVAVTGDGYDCDFPLLFLLQF